MLAVQILLRMRPGNRYFGRQPRSYIYSSLCPDEGKRQVALFFEPITPRTAGEEKPSLGLGLTWNITIWPNAVSVRG